MEILEVSPALAKGWLSRNPNNRNLRKAVIESYARDTRAASWVLNVETQVRLTRPAARRTASPLRGGAG